ncbi:DUF4055 domain-containing protein [Janthinobacterium sp. SUN033]|uniref:DUF4055 domain-containing protein n=1 Tax=Janthinobacterium sp. SUN033 TaxID=3002439 RepID=UPI0025AF432B|nr:DUF4055 domain-containing protein [Janthinobacterium sp. SUN033]MDN2676719.1 DUF4055 domain-containing protein [Janthinobacterium sp. SUN033]
MNDAVRKQSAEAAKLNEDCALIAALLGGTKTMRAAGKKYLPQWPGEDDKSYELRLAVATLFPAYARTIDVLSAKPFSKPVTLGEDVPERLKPWLQNVDLSGRDLHSFLSEITQDAMGYGFAGILVDFPKAGNLVTKADEQAAGVRPYFVQVHVQNVLGWLPKNATSLNGLTQLRLLESVSEPNGDFDTKEIEQVRVLGRGTWQTWRQREAGSKKEWALFEEGVTSLQTIPFVPVYGKRLGYMQATPPLLELAHSNIEHWQSKSDQQNILHIARVPILFAKMLEGSDIAVGAGTAVKSDSPDGDLKFVEHGGKAIEAGRLSILDLEDRMRQAGAELLVIKPGNVTESQTLADNEQGACALQKIAQNIQDAANQALQFMAEWVGEKEGGHIKLHTDFGAESLAATSAEQLLKAQLAGAISLETLFGEFKRRNIISMDIDWDGELARIESQGAGAGGGGGYRIP